MDFSTLHVKKASDGAPHAYVEKPNTKAASIDILRQFEANMATLEDLSSRLRFMMVELKGLIR